MLKPVFVLAWLTEIGMACVRAAGRRAAAGAPGANVARAAGAFDRMTRAVRLTIALARHTFQMFRAWRLAPDAAPDILAELDAAEAGEDRPETENLTDYEDLDEFRWLFREPLSEQEQFERILKKPFDEIVARICKDLGVKFDREAWACGAKPEAVFDAGEGEQAVSEVGLQRPHIGSSGKLNAEDAEARRARGEEKFRLEPSGGP